MIIPTARPSRTWTHRSRAVTIAMASFMAVVPSLAAAQCGALEPGPTRVVTRVETSTTLRLDDGSEVVLVNVWPPTRIDNAAEDTWRPEQTARAALTTLVEGHSVDLAFSGRRMDRYGRHLAQVFVHDGTERIWVQGRVISDGWARAFALPGQLVCLDDLIAAERHARSNARGFWGDGVFQDQSAADARSLVRLRDTFQTVTGRVARVSQVRGETVLQLSPDGLHGFHVTMARTTKADATIGTGVRGTTGGGVGGSGRRTKSSMWNDFVGKQVRVRGFLERRTGPFITLNDYRDVEILEAADAVDGADPAPRTGPEPQHPIPVHSPP
jgi:micrococcal nuclease